MRDADKLDIIRTWIRDFSINTHALLADTLDLDADDRRISGDILADAMSGVSPKYEKLTYLNDFKLVLCCWIYDLTFVPSLLAVKKRGYLEQIFSMLPDSIDMEVLKLRLEGYVDEETEHLEKPSPLKPVPE